ncbi:RusA family crossover junction endodeoxyribonuclease [Corynebacterium diphtheriae]|nr:RusA family crossover junction endodeoxyribonuclease [Corynebacterium diphtheriae]
MIQFNVNGIPAPQGSKNAYRHGNKVLLVESSKKLPAWRTAVKNTATHHCHTPQQGPISLTLTFRLPRPKTLPKKITHMIKKTRPRQTHPLNLRRTHRHRLPG